jgi:hypothetical protein
MICVIVLGERELEVMIREVENEGAYMPCFKHEIGTHDKAISKPG